VSNVHFPKFVVYNIRESSDSVRRRNKEVSKQYYELDDVIRLLGKSRSTIIREANAGKIPTEGPKRNRRYPKEAIDALAEIEESKKHKKEQDLIFSPSTPNDLWQEVAIGRELYGDNDIVSFKTLLQWREINDEMFMSLKYKGEVVGYSSLMPLDEDVILALINDKLREQDIPLEAIRQWTDQNISVYVASVTVRPSGSPTRDAERAGIIIKNTIKWALALDRQTKIKNWYSIGATENGQDLLEALGFKELVSLYNGERKGYYLDSIKKPVSLVSRILDRLNQESELSQSQV
jgi:hypothetical protein